MARPIKNNCSYFSHDADMRNHRKVKAIRNCKNGYAIWVMLLEYLTSADGNTFEDCEIEIELLSGDFGFPTSEIREVLDYCYKLELLFKNDGFCFSESLNDRLAVVYTKRGKARDISRKQHRINGKFSINNTVTTELPTSEIPHSKVKESKEDKSKGNEISIYPSFLDFWNEYDKKHDRAVCERKWGKLSQAEREAIMNYIPTYKLSQPDKNFRKNPEAFLNRRAWENEIVIPQTATQKREQEQIKNLGKTFYEYNKNSGANKGGTEYPANPNAIGQ